ncbi:siroheme synthase CysG [Oharaeibacter diazotrophicus]|uniref:Uroporphyrinogen-III C-methyltransferase n=2 Tax=Oharaeibacter diazotrophicus TaxID=1920512 RepID=A0A4R6R9N2_9HYPH|nr:siroheme synthase CysG [Oharaeibacter diazotrophicus]TDP82781.1 uroporphyrinogen-III C-methyltransferase [Oharaeibacter diazotrophicus]BBE72457.1 siroheme synthase [Pleomorphomonas sp. SM30]
MTRQPRSPREAEPARMGPLAKLPVFLDLHGRRAVVAGGSAGAAWKAELLAAAGAAVDVYAAEPSDEMERLVARGAEAGSLTLHRRPWSVDVLTGAAFALIDAEGEAEAQAFRCAGRAAGAIVNAVDKPAHCDVQFGSIVNRSPVVVGISTDGAAPILGQAIRRRIETLLPPGLAAWGGLAKRVRERVTERLKPGQERRGFWEHLAEKAFGAPPAEGEAERLLAEAERIATGGGDGRGRVILVGAGPGDAELLTLKAVRALQAADVILFDDLVSDEVLELARREAKRMMVGKRGGRDSCRQEDINALMVQLARQGRRVVRLKAGDPMVFGRAGEEIAMLEAAGIPVEVVPGISAAIALASALGVSLTHRDASHSLRFVTGHAKNGELDPTLDWRGLADPDTTLMVYMGGRTAPAIAGRLIAEGLDPATPVAIGYAVGQPAQRIAGARLADLLVTGAIEPGLPVVIGVGRVFEAVAAAAVGVATAGAGRGGV